MTSDSRDIPLRVWAMKGGVIGAAIMSVMYAGLYLDIANFAGLHQTPSRLIRDLTKIFFACCIPAIPTALLVGMAHRRLCHRFASDSRRILALTLLSATLVCSMPCLGLLIASQPEITIGQTLTIIQWFGIAPLFAALAAAAVVLSTKHHKLAITTDA